MANGNGFRAGPARLPGIYVTGIQGPFVVGTDYGVVNASVSLATVAAAPVGIVSQPGGTTLFNVVNLDERDADAAVLAGNNCGELPGRRQGREDARFLWIGKSQSVSRKFGR